MSSTKKSKEILESELKTIQENGIQADRKHLKQNMYTQFSDPLEFAREYVVNSYDAMATECYISGRETEDTVTVTIRDNGKGMSYQRLQDYFKIFRSRKDHPDKAIGRFGVGKMSVAAVPGLLLFSGQTSTGKECWQFETDNLIDDRPVILKRIEPVSPTGTKFEITFIKTAPLSDLLFKIFDILKRYVQYLDIDIYFDLPELDKELNPIRKKLPKGQWNFTPDELGKSYQVVLNHFPVEVTMGIEKEEHELYQNKVFITSKYNLLSYGLPREIKIPNLRIRVNSDLFELTFGRHCLSNESILTDLCSKIREKLLPEYFDYLLSNFNEEMITDSPEIVSKIEEMAIGLLLHNSKNKSWSTFPLFNTHHNKRISFLQLNDAVLKCGLVYVEAAKNEGTDYDLFNAPVLKKDQPKGALNFLLKVFGKKIIDLNLHDTVIEISNNRNLILTPEEKNFEKFLVIQAKKEVLEKIIDNGKNPDFNINCKLKALENNIGICEEARIVEHEFSSLTWKVNYLVERDGKTPCKSRKFIVLEAKIVLNLYHSEIREFVELSCIDPKLSAHWAMAMCLSDPKLLPHITPDTREDVLLIDAMSRIGSDSNFIREQGSTKLNNQVMDFLRNCKNKLGGNNEPF